jgi:acyl-CoA thioesterase II
MSTIGDHNEVHSKVGRFLICCDKPVSADDSHLTHILAIIQVSDLYILDTPLALHGLSYGIPVIGDGMRRQTRSDTKSLATLNHTIHFHAQRGFRADDPLYVESDSPWAVDARSLSRSKIFTKDGRLIASCTQEVSCYTIVPHVL